MTWTAFAILAMFPLKIRIFLPKRAKFGPKLAFLVILGPALPAHLVPLGGLVGGCGARAVSRKTPIYFMLYTQSYGNFREKCFFFKFQEHWNLRKFWNFSENY